MDKLRIPEENDVERFREKAAAKKLSNIEDDMLKNKVVLENSHTDLYRVR